jgi:hypothetical protein
LPDGLSGNLPVGLFCRGSGLEISLAREAMHRCPGRGASL